jgi:hypothetical protein
VKFFFLVAPLHEGLYNLTPHNGEIVCLYIDADVMASGGVLILLMCKEEELQHL